MKANLEALHYNPHVHMLTVGLARTPTYDQESLQPLVDEKEVHAWAEVSPKALRAQSEPEVTSADVV